MECNICQVILQAFSPRIMQTIRTQNCFFGAQMDKDRLAEIILQGENSGIEFKRDDIRPQQLGKEIAALLNLAGGYILLGVEDNGIISGLTRTPEKAEQWVMDVARNHVRPGATVYWNAVSWDSKKTVGVITLPNDAPDKLYKAKRGASWVTQSRIGTTTRDSTREEEACLYMRTGTIRYDRFPVLGATLADLDFRRLINYFRDVRLQTFPEEQDTNAWTNLLANTDFMFESNGQFFPTAGGLLLFGKNPKRYLSQSGILATAYSGTEKDYDAKARQLMRGPLVSLYPAQEELQYRSYPEIEQTFSDSGIAVEAGVIDQAINFVRKAIHVSAYIDSGGRRQEVWDYPLEAIREAIVNAVSHRDYSIELTDIELSLYSDRFEIVSPGSLPNTVTTEKMKAGCRASRNELVKDVLRDYRYMEATGLGVPRRIVKGMHLHNQTEVDLIEKEDQFTVRLWR